MRALQHRVLLREAIKMMLREAGEDVRSGEALEAEEREAKAAFERAKAALDRWDAENNKKIMLTNKANELGVKLGDNKATKQLRSQPQFNYDVKLLQTKRETLVNALEKARNEYGAYEPSAVGYKLTSTGGSKTPADMQRPDPSTKVFMPIEQVKPLRWYAWNDPRWSKAIKGVAFGSSKEKSGEEQSGTGPGEERLARILGGKVQGGAVSFDVVTPDDRRWEVKALESSSTLIRPGTEGRAAFDRPKKQLDSIIKQINNFVIVAKKLGHETLALDDDDLRVMAYAESFVDTELSMFAKGEVPPERFKTLRAVLKALSSLKARWLAEGAGKNVNTTVGLADKKINVDKPTFIDVAKRVQKSKPDVDVLSSFEERELALATLKNAAFNDPKAFFNEWFESVDINRVFSQVDGVFIVSPTGFNMVPKPLFRKAFRFRTISQNMPRFKFVYYDGSPSTSE